MRHISCTVRTLIGVCDLGPMVGRYFLFLQRKLFINWAAVVIGALFSSSGINTKG